MQNILLCKEKCNLSKRDESTLYQDEKVVITKTQDSQKIIEINLRDSLEILGFEVSDNDRIVIKPNLCDFRPAWEGGTTDPRIVEAFIKIIREKASPEITVVESDHAVATADEEFERMGYTEMAQRLGVNLLNLSNDKRFDVALEGHYFETLKSTETLLRATKIISIAKLKTHSQQKITCNMKNLFGLLPEKYKSKYHPFMSEVLVDLAEFYKPFCIVDGIVGMEGSGPSDGERKEAGVIIVGSNPVAVDAAAARLMGFNPGSIPNLNYAKKMKIGTIHPQIIGDNSVSKFEFIPFYSYWIQRFSLNLSKIGYMFSNMVNGFSKFLSQASGGLIVVVKGSYVSSEMGVLMRKDALRFAKGLILRIFVQVKLYLLS